MIKKILKTFFILFLISIFLLFIYLFPLIKNGKEIAESKIHLMVKENFNLLTNTTMKDGEGNLLSDIIDKDYTYVKYEDVPQILVKAYVLIEDKHFFEHKGIDYSSLVRAAISIIKNKGRITQGGSTITQQIVKNVFLTQERTIKRKVPEFFLSYEMEKKYSKEEIFEYYINTNYYGNGCYGIYSASKYYFDKEPKELSVAEIATIIGLSNSPSLYNPISNSKKALEKRDFILNELYNKKIITEIEFNKAKKSLLLPEKFTNK